MERYIVEKDSFPIVVEFARLDNGFERHTHGQYEMVIVLNGEADHIVDKSCYKIKKGDTFVINKHSSHAYTNTKDFELVNIGFTGYALAMAGNEIKKIPGFHALFLTGPAKPNSPFLCTLWLSPFSLSESIKLLKKLEAELNLKKDGFEVIARAYFFELIVLISREYSNASDHTIICLAKAASYMEENYYKKITLSKIAEISGFSERHFDRLFKKNYNKSPIQYLTDIRLQIAKELIVKTKLPMIEVAMRCGFYDDSVLSKYFKQKYGVSPNELRKKY